MAKTSDETSIKTEDHDGHQIITNESTSKQIVTTRRQNASRKSWSSWLLRQISRLTIWFTLITIIFRCPSDPNLLTGSVSDSVICKPYLTIRSYLDPVVGPYYDEYASPFVERARPYVDMTNTRVIRPATVLAAQNYQLYAAPQLAKVQSYAQSQWERNAAPQLRKAQETAQQVYDENLAAHVQKASEVAAPLYESALDNAMNAREKHILPVIAFTQPHLMKGVRATQKFLLDKALPFVRHSSTRILIFLDGTLWPFVKSVYKDNVQPQLVMIGERIAKYQESRKLQSVIEDAAVSSSISVTNTIEVKTETSTTSTENAVPVSSSASPSSPDRETPSSHVANDETISADLVKWQKKFAVAANTGGDDLRERIESIVTSMLKSELGEGRGLAGALEKTAEVEVDNVKEKIISVVLLLPEAPKSQELTSAESEVYQTIREAGSQIKEKAKAMRVWANDFEKALKQRTDLACDSTVQVLDGIRDLGLQEIGMRWAWMEGVTYKHWQKYHDLKKRFAEWTAEVKESALLSPVITDARSQVDNLLEESMTSTESTAKELIRLRDVAKWKIARRDATDDFDTRSIPVVGSALSAASSLAADVRDMTSIFVGDKQDSIESHASTASSDIGGLGRSASSIISETSETLAASVPTGSSRISEAAEEIPSSASSILAGSSTGPIESVSSKVSSAASSLSSSASLKISSATAPPSEGLLSSASTIADSISYSVSSAVADASSSLHGGTPIGAE